MLYAKTKRVIPQIGADLGLIVWVAAWAYLAVLVRNLIVKLADPAHSALTTVESTHDQITSAAEAVADAPLVGGILEPPLSSLGAVIGGLATALEQYISVVSITSIILALVVFVVPVVIYLWKWLPWRFRFVREASGGKRLLSADASPKLFALRAIASAPMRELAKITPDPMGAWERGDAVIIRKLANLELARGGLKLPPPRSPSMERPTAPYEDIPA